jgi:hypothetical protein
MAAIKIKAFGGMIPAVDDRLLTDSQAARAENVWVYDGSLIGLPTLKAIHTCDQVSTAKVYRIPFSYGDALTFDDSIWLEFTNGFTDVIRAPVVDDIYDRYYWVSSSQDASYTTRLRLEYNATPYESVFTTTHASELINITGHPLEIGDKVRVSTSAADLPSGLTIDTDYYVAVTSFGANSFRLSTTLHGATFGTSLVTLADDGTGTHTLTTQTHQEWLLGVPAPTVAPGVVVTGGSAAVVSRSYVYTWVTAYGEEGPPSPPTLTTDNPDGSWDLTLTAPTADDLGVDRYITKVRIYRTVTGGSGVASFFYVAEQDVSDTTYSDTASDTTVTANDQLESTNWAGPPDDLEGWLLMPNGIVAGWRENELWFSEPYRPHAWNANNTLAVEYPITGLGIANQTLVVCTGGFPMTASGILPSTISTAKLANFEPCLGRGSIISAPEGVYYASPNGIILVRPGSAENISRNLITKDKWQGLTNVSAIKAARLGTAIYAFGTAQVGIFDEDAFQEDMVESEDLTQAFTGFLLDVQNQRVAYSILTSEDVTVAVTNDAWSGELFVIRDDVVYWLDQTDSTPVYAPYLWRSKVFQLQTKKNLAAMRVFFTTDANTPDLNPVPNDDLVQDLAADQYGLVRAYADGELVWTREIRTSGELMRLPSGFKAAFWQFEIESRVRVYSFEVASSVKELTVV